jgi:hypothetical protein
VLCKAIEDAEKGLGVVSLGSEVMKLRVARKGKGKSGGYRTIIYYRKADKAFFVYGYAKQDQDNISQGDVEDLKELASASLNSTDVEIEARIKNNLLVEVKYGKKI